MEHPANNSVNSQLSGLSVSVLEQHVHLSFKSPVRIVSSAILNGGYLWADHILNLQVVGKTTDGNSILPPPDITLLDYAKNHGWEGTCVGMMTSALMSSFRHEWIQVDDVGVECFLTCGVSNACRAGDPADERNFGSEKPAQGTINIILGTNAKLSDAAMIEAIMIISEAKAAVFQKLNILSVVSQKIATGTGTDSIVVFNGFGREITYCGKHVLFGEMIAKVVSKALESSLNDIPGF
jgi:adenosylcobinamide amidohydrolase